MRQYNRSGAEEFTRSVETLYLAMERKFGSERAWEFVLAFYTEAATNG